MRRQADRGHARNYDQSYLPSPGHTLLLVRWCPLGLCSKLGQDRVALVKAPLREDGDGRNGASGEKGPAYIAAVVVLIKLKLSLSLSLALSRALSLTTFIEQEAPITWLNVRGVSRTYGAPSGLSVRGQFTLLGHIPGGGRPLLREGARLATRQGFLVWSAQTVGCPCINLKTFSRNGRVHGIRFKNIIEKGSSARAYNLTEYKKNYFWHVLIYYLLKTAGQTLVLLLTHRHCSHCARCPPRPPWPRTRRILAAEILELRAKMKRGHA